MTLTEGVDITAILLTLVLPAVPALIAFGALRQQVKNQDERLKETKADCDRRIERLENTQDKEVERLEGKIDEVHSRVNKLADDLAEFRSDVNLKLGEIIGRLDNLLGHSGRRAS